MVASIRITGAENFARAAKQLRQADKELQKAFRKEIRDLTTPLKAEASQAALALPAAGNSHFSTRRAVAAAVAAKISYSNNKAGVRIAVNAAKLPERMRGFARAANKGRWRHPTFGNPDRWVEQTSNAQWLRKALDPRAKDFAKKLDAAVTRVLQRL